MSKYSKSQLERWWGGFSPGDRQEYSDSFDCYYRHMMGKKAKYRRASAGKAKVVRDDAQRVAWHAIERASHSAWKKVPKARY
jgi:hypothetical protein